MCITQDIRPEGLYSGGHKRAFSQPSEETRTDVIYLNPNASKSDIRFD